MERHNCLYWIIFLLLLNQTGKSCTFACSIPDSDQTHEIATLKEGARADLRYKLTVESYNLESFTIEIRLCDSGNFRTVCKCRWVSMNKSDCKQQDTDFICDMKDYEMGVSFSVNRSYTSVVWKLYKPNSVPVVLKHVMLQVTGVVPYPNQTPQEEIILEENTQADFSLQLKSENNQTIKEAASVIEIKMSESGKYYDACRCRWLSKSNAICKNQRNVSICETDNYEMRFSLLVKRSYKDIIWELYRTDCTPLTLKKTKLQVTYPAKVTGLEVNGREVNETHLVDDNQKVIISCFFTNGNPPVSVRLLDNIGNAQSSTKHEEGPLTLILGIFHCSSVWPTIRCEAPGSELNRSVTILGRCLPQLSHIGSELLPLSRVFKEGLKLRLRSYTSDVRKCQVTKSPPQPATMEVSCKLSGIVPDLILTMNLAGESWIQEGIWTLHALTELGYSNITFVLINNTRESK